MNRLQTIEGTNTALVSATVISSGTLTVGDVFNYIRIPKDNNFDQTNDMSYGTSTIKSIVNNRFTQTLAAKKWNLTVHTGSSGDSSADIVDGKIYVPNETTPDAIAVMTPSGSMTKVIG